MKRIVLLAGLLIGFVATSSDVDGAQKLTDAQRARIKRMLDTDGDGVISAPERGVARIIKGANRQQRAINKNNRVIQRIK